MNIFIKSCLVHFLYFDKRNYENCWYKTCGRQSAKSTGAAVRLRHWCKIKMAYLFCAIQVESVNSHRPSTLSLLVKKKKNTHNSVAWPIFISLSRELNNEPSNSTKGGEFLQYLSLNQIFKDFFRDVNECLVARPSYHNTVNSAIFHPYIKESVIFSQFKIQYLGYSSCMMFLIFSIWCKISRNNRFGRTVRSLTDNNFSPQ
jgi:hypothetical protein